MHPSKFFNEVNIRVGIDTVEVFGNEPKYKLVDAHPLNFIKSKIIIPVYEISMSYFTNNWNYKNVTKYMILGNIIENEYADLWVDMFARDYEEKYKLHNMKVLEMKHICDAVLQIG